MSDDRHAGKYRERAAAEMTSPYPPLTTTGPIMRQVVNDTAALLRRGPVDARQRARAAREYAVDHLEELHEQLRGQFARRGVGYHRAATGAEAVEMIRGILGDARRVPKSKSMVSEEIGLTHALRAAGIDILETDIGEYIVDIEGRGPSHIIFPAVHLNRVRIREILQRTGADLPDDDPVRLSQYVRDVVGTYFADCDAAITGANMAVAESGRIVIVENEGNVSLGVSHPRKHIVVTGLEKVVATDEDALAILQVLAPSATAQPLTSFSHLLGDPPAGQERHVVFVDNGRSRVLQDPRYRDVLRCIRCGACMNACPVYRAAGGLSYGSPYMGPIGAVVSPLLWPDGGFEDLPAASSLCGRCTEVCPVGIPLHEMLLELRADASANASRKEQAAWRAWSATYSGSSLRGRVAGSGARLGAAFASRVPGIPLPLVAPERRDPEALTQARPAVPGPADGARPPAPMSLLPLFVQRARDLGITVENRPPEPRPGDRTLAAAAAIANTGSVLVAGSDADRRALLGAGRIIVTVDPSVLVRHPIELVRLIPDVDAVILTGPSRTADIEKQIVRGIHGAEEMVIVVAAPISI